MVSITRKKDVGQPGNPGQFASTGRAGSGLDLGAGTLQTAGPIQRLQLQAGVRQVREWVRLLEAGDLELDAPYQRGHVWSVDQRLGLVRSWLAAIPVPSVTINDRFGAGQRTPHGPTYAVVDGKQRITTARMWLQGEFAAPVSWFEPDWIEETEGTADGPYVRHPGLTQAGQRLMENRMLMPVSEAQVDGVEGEAQLYLLLNGGGTAHTAQDMDRARTI